MRALRGHQPIIPMNYGRQERKTLFGAVNLNTGALTGQIADTGNAKTFQKFLETIRVTCPRGIVVMILDNVRFHHAKALQRWRTRYPRMQFLFLPPYHPKLNPQEMARQILRRNVTHNTYYPTFKQEIAAARRFFKHARVEIRNAPASLIVRK